MNRISIFGIFILITVSNAIAVQNPARRRPREPVETQNPAPIRQVPNSANRTDDTLDTTGLKYRPVIDNIFYGRFDRLREDDPYNTTFAWIFYELIRQYGESYPDFLKPPVHQITRTDSATGVRTTTTIFKMEERFVASFQRNEQKRTAVFYHADIPDNVEKILQRHHPATSQALALLYENLYRYANNLPSAQERPQLSGTTSPTPDRPASETQGPRTSLSKAVERYLKSRASVTIPNETLASTADFITGRFQKIPLRPSDKKNFLAGTGEQETFLLWMAYQYTSGDLISQLTKDQMRQFLDEIVAEDPLLFAALNCASCPTPQPQERPSGFAARFLRPRANRASALSNELLVQPEKFEGLRDRPLEMRLQWRSELPGNLGGRLLKCEYLPDDNTMVTRSFRYYWYQATPAGWVQTSRSLSRNHPLLTDVGAPRTSCPDRW